jgi:hypothetical protein
MIELKLHFAQNALTWSVLPDSAPQTTELNADTWDDLIRRTVSLNQALESSTDRDVRPLVGRLSNVGRALFGALEAPDMPWTAAGDDFRDDSHHVARFHISGDELYRELPWELLADEDGFFTTRPDWHLEIERERARGEAVAPRVVEQGLILSLLAQVALMQNQVTRALHIWDHALRMLALVDALPLMVSVRLTRATLLVADAGEAHHALALDDARQALAALHAAKAWPILLGAADAALGVAAACGEHTEAARAAAYGAGAAIRVRDRQRAARLLRSLTNAQLAAREPYPEELVDLALVASELTEADSRESFQISLEAAFDVLGLPLDGLEGQLDDLYAELENTLLSEWLEPRLATIRDEAPREALDDDEAVPLDVQLEAIEQASEQLEAEAAEAASTEDEPKHEAPVETAISEETVESLLKRKKVQLIELARERDIQTRSRWNKRQIAEAIVSRER